MDDFAFYTDSVDQFVSACGENHRFNYLADV